MKKESTIKNMIKRLKAHPVSDNGHDPEMWIKMGMDRALSYVINDGDLTPLKTLEGIQKICIEGKKRRLK